VTVPQGHVWIEGDNGLVSKDSRMFGAIPLAMVTAKNVGIVWPLSRFRMF
jgi:Signal peptidase, peptidase S26